MGEEPEDDLQKPDIHEDSYNSFPPLRESPGDAVGLTDFHSLPYKRNIGSLDGSDSPAEKRIKVQQQPNQYPDPSNFQPDNMFAVPVPQIPSSDHSVQNNNS